MTTTKSCIGCPSNVGDEVVVQITKKSIGANACVRHGFILGYPGASEPAKRKIGQTFAKDCNDCGQPKPVHLPDALKAQVAKPLADAVTEGLKIRARDGEKAAPVSCNACRYLVPETTTYREFKFAAPLCAATGRLIFPNRLHVEAKACSYGVTGSIVSIGSVPLTHLDVKNIELLPVYAEADGLDFGDYDFTDPTEYESDREVLPEEAAMGIRAWREVTDPEEYGEPVEFPIFDDSAFDEMEQLSIPVAGADGNPEAYNDFDGLVYQVGVEWFGLDRIPVLISEAGLGKTELGRHLAWLMHAPFDRINFNKSSDVDSLIGTWMFVDGETRWKNGRIPKGWERVRVQLLDEPNRADTVIQEMLLPMADNSKQLVLESAARPYTDPETGETVYLTPPPLTRHPFSMTLMAINPAWNPLYHGTIELDGALISRVGKIELRYPPPDAEAEILVRAYKRAFDQVPPKKTFEAVVGIGKELRELASTGGLPMSWGVREQIGVLLASKYYRLPKAYLRTVGDYYEPRTREQIMDVVKAHWRG